VNCLREIFWKYWLRMKIDIDLQIKESDQPENIIVKPVIRKTTG